MNVVRTPLTRAAVPMSASKNQPQTDLDVQRINSNHNFTQQEWHFGEEIWVTRKGEIKAANDTWAMIPGRLANEGARLTRTSST